MIADDAFDALAEAEALDIVAVMIDLAGDRSDAGLTARALALSERLVSRPTLTADSQILLHYFRANAFENQLHQAGDAQSWSWELAHYEQVLLELRGAVRHEGFADLGQFRQCQILTNLGNKLSAIGRPCEALAHWDRAITLNPRFAMALGNRGHGLMAYARSLYDGGHAGLLMGSAHAALTAASAADAVYDSPGWAQVIVTRTAGSGHAHSRLNTRHRWKRDPDWWGRQCGAIWQAAQEYLPRTTGR